MALFSNPKMKAIEKVQLLGVRTGEETKIFTRVNFSVYSFMITYTDGSVETVELSSQDKKQAERLSKLLKMANADGPNGSAIPQEVKPPMREASSVYADLKNIKDLFDAGIMTEDIFEAQKEKLLKELSEITAAENEPKLPTHYNLVLTKSQPRDWPNKSKVFVKLDGVEKDDIDLNDGAVLTLMPGEHSITYSYSKRITGPFTFTIEEGSICQVQARYTILKGVIAEVSTKPYDPNK